jgi:trehalose 6-phosphate phosphatase
MLHAAERTGERIAWAERLRLFLDYDGTLADFAPTPEHVDPDPELIALIARLVEHRAIRPTVISGRRLEHVERLLPVAGVLLAGTYGVELRLPDGERIDRLSYKEVRPVLGEIKPRWGQLIDGRDGFFLEDKGWSLAIHARDVSGDEAGEVLNQARRMAAVSVGEAGAPDLFWVVGGHKFLEVGPTLAHKGKTVDYLLDRYPWPDALLLYVGDDDKDEEAFGVIHAHGGIAIKVCEEPCETDADGRLASPEETRRWVGTLPTRLER